MKALPQMSLVKLLVPCEVGTSRETESLWAEAVEGGFVVRNSPFYATGIAWGDIVSAELRDGALWHTGLIKASGHSTVQILFLREGPVRDSVTRHLQSLRCGAEGSDLPNLIAVDVPSDVSYSEVRTYLEEQESAGILGFREACLGH